MKKASSLLVMAALAMFTLNSFAVGPNPKPKCPMGQLPVMEQGMWQCQQAKIKAKEKGMETSVQGPYKMQQHGQAAPDAGPKPRCPKGQLPKMENGQWMCKEMGLTAPGNPDAQAAKVPKPKCPMSKLPKFENGQWVCRQPAYSSGENDQE